MVHREREIRPTALVGQRSMLLTVLGLAVLAALGYAAPVAAQNACEKAGQSLRPGGDSTAELEHALQACAGKTLHIPAGTYELRPKGFANGIVVPADTTIEGAGPKQTVLRVADTGTFAAVFWIRDVSNVAIHNLGLRGSPYESGCTRGLEYGHAIEVASDAGKGASVENIDISGDEFTDFNGTSWVTLNAQDGSAGIGLKGHITISNNVFESDQALRGSCAGTGISHSTDMISLHGANGAENGMVEGVVIKSNTFNAAYVNTAVAIWSATAHIHVQSNVIRDDGAGLKSAPRTEFGRYAVLIYSSSHDPRGRHPEEVSVTDNEITNPVSCGVYVAGAQILEISHNRISGQRDQFDVTLPKGAISLNHAARVRAEDNELTNNYIGISAVNTEGSVDPARNRITPAAGGKASKIVRGPPGWSQPRPGQQQQP